MAHGGVLARLPKGDLQQIIAVGSGKGGVGKSSVTALLASELARQGHTVGILDADVTGPSIPLPFGQKGPLKDQGHGIEPAVTANGVKIVSSQFLVENEDTPVIWRGPLVTRLITQFFAQVNWGPLEYLLLDMPPGTSDVPLTVFQTIPIDGMVFVTTPQELSSLIVKKAIVMAEELHVPLLGLVENMVEVKCPHCGEVFSPYGKSHTEKMASDHSVDILCKLPVDAQVSELGDAGRVYDYSSPKVGEMTQALLKGIVDSKKRNLRVF